MARPINYWNIAVIAYRDHALVAEAVRRRLEGSWTIHPGARFSTVDLADLDTELMESLDAVVLIVDSEGPESKVLCPLSDFEDMHIPVLALLEASPRPGSVFEHAGALVDGRGTDGRVLCARLHGLLHRQREVNQLRREIAVAGRSHGELHVEVAKMHEQLHLAALAQRDFLPQEIPALHGVTVAALWRPATYVSGDIYDVVQLDRDHLGIFVADAVGHGVSAALMTMVILQSLTTTQLDGSSWRIIPPTEVLARLNDQMNRRQGRPTRFATAAYAVLDCRRRHLTLAGAGHPPPLLVHDDGTSLTLETHGGLLGVFKDEAYDQVELDLEVDDRLLLYSDGFEQAFPLEEDKGERRWRRSTRYREEFEHLSTVGTPKEMIDMVSRRLDVQSGSLHQVDDLTLVCVHAGPLATREPLQASQRVAQGV